MKPVKQQNQGNLKWVADFIWNIADDRLRDVYVRGKYRDVILPFTVLEKVMRRPWPNAWADQMRGLAPPG